MNYKKSPLSSIRKCKAIAALLGVCLFFSATSFGRDGKKDECSGLPDFQQIKGAATDFVGMVPGFGLDVWITVVNRDGEICNIAFTGSDRGAQFPGSRIVSAQKAFTANAFSTTVVALGTSNLYAGTQPGQSLYHLDLSNMLDSSQAYTGKPSRYGQKNDPLKGKIIGGVIIFGGGLALYNSDGIPIGGLGISGESSCADHFIAFRARVALGLNNGPENGDGSKTDQIVFGEGNHPNCLTGDGVEDELDYVTILNGL